MDESRRSSPWRRRALLIAGLLCAGLGIVGILLPVLPTTPFLLLAATCFAKSSQRFHDWLLNNRFLGAYIRNYRDHSGIPLGTKLFALAALWLTIGYSTIFVIDRLWVQIILLLIACSVTIHLIRFPTLKP